MPASVCRIDKQGPTVWHGGLDQCLVINYNGKDSGKEYICVELEQHCKSTILQLKKIKILYDTPYMWNLK